MQDQRSQRQIRNILYVVILLVTIPILLIVLWFIGIQIEAMGYVGYIQEAIDEQCPELSVVVDVEGFSGDPFPNWSSPQASCWLDSSEWNCGCSGIP